VSSILAIMKSAGDPHSQKASLLGSLGYLSSVAVMFVWFVQIISGAKRFHHSMFNVRCWMFNVQKTLYSDVLRFPYLNEWYGFVFIFYLTGYTRYTGFFLGNFSPEAIVNHVNPVGKKCPSCSIRIVNIVICWVSLTETIFW
jgi:hypothetical protein